MNRRGGYRAELAAAERRLSSPDVDVRDVTGAVPVEQISAPTLIINATQAMLAPHDDAARFAARLQAAKLLEIDTGGHVLIGNVARLREAVTGFLDDHP